MMQYLLYGIRGTSVLPVVMCPVSHESWPLHGDLGVVQGEAEWIGERDGHKHLLLHLRCPTHLQAEEEKKSRV